MANDALTIGDLPPASGGAQSTDLVEIQRGTGPGSSLYLTLAEVLALGGTMKFPSAKSLPTTTGVTVPATVASSAAGALSANTYKEVLNLTTPGILHGVCVRSGGTASKTVGVRVTIDGVVVAVVDLPTAVTSATTGLLAGYILAASGTIAPCFAPFQTLKVEVRSSIATSEVLYDATYVGL